jgi:hypothetical protein
MTTEGLFRPRGLITAIALLIGGLLVAWACVRATIVRMVPSDLPELVQLVPHHPEVVLANATAALVKQRGILAPETLAAVKRAAQDVPLDVRPFLILGHQQLLDDQPQRAVLTLQAGQRLEPRDRLIHVLLLDRYLRTNRYEEAAVQFSVASRLVGEAQGPIAAAMAQFSLEPATREAVRRTLATDAALERSVLSTLAKSNTPAATIFALASPGAMRDAANAGSWGPILISRLVDKENYSAARTAWQRIYHLDAVRSRGPVYDAGFAGLPGSPPFNWTLTGNSLGAADFLGGTLSVDYYGRDTGELASQLLLLTPGSYRFAVTVEGAKTGAGPWLSWSLRCVSGSKAELMSLAVISNGTRHRVGAGIVVPSGCPAQQLALIGNAGDFPTPIDASFRDLDLRPASVPAS